MQLVRGLHNLPPAQDGCVATIGNFDGVHRGHQAILERLRARAEQLGLPCCVVIFEPQSREFFDPEGAPPRLTPLRDKLQLLAAAGVDRVLCLPFNRRLREMSAADFVTRVLVDGLRVRHLEVGDDFRFGCDRAGDFTFLQQAGSRYGFTVEAATTIELDGRRVGSTQVREALTGGRFDLAEALLGRPWCITGRVVHGQKLGRQLGFPTANVQLKKRKIPLIGIYVVSARIDDGPALPGVASIGLRPTVKSDGLPHLEVYLLDFNQDIYGSRMQVRFVHKLRDEQRFASLEALKVAIAKDIDDTRAYFRRPTSPERTQ